MAKQPDWEAVEAAYRAGSLSVRAIGEAHGVTHVAIGKRAAKEGWQRDLSEKVRAATKAKVTKAVTTDGYQSKAVTDDEIIEEASDQLTAVVLSHRKGLARWQAIADKLNDTLSDMSVAPDAVGEFSRALNAGVDAQLKIIKGQRQAFNLDAEQSDKTVSDLAALMDDLSTEA